MTDTENERLLALLEHARNFTPFYRDLLPPVCSPLPENVAELFKTLPLLTRNDLQKKKLWLRSLVGKVSTWRAIRTSGTTGEPVEVLLDERTRVIEFAILASHIDRCLPDQEWRDRKLIHATMHAGSSSRAQRSELHPSAEVAKWNLLRLWQANDQEFVVGMTYLNHCVVTFLPSVAELIARRILSAGASDRVLPLLIVLSGETIEPEQLNIICTAFRCVVTSLYTMAEVGIVGTGCTANDGYHVGEDTALVEIIDGKGQYTAPDIEGEVVVTALDNLAMPLIRYRTADRGYWSNRSCGCGLSTPRIILTTARRPSRVVSTIGATMNVLRFTKAFASLNIERFLFEQTRDGAVVMSYRAAECLEVGACSLIEGSVRAALGPEVQIRIRRVSKFGSEEHSETGSISGPVVSLLSTEPALANAAQISSWLRAQLDDQLGIEVAVLTGSFVTPEASTRFSDIDLVILIRTDVQERRWIELSRRLHSTLPKLAVIIDKAEKLSDRSPLVACRLLSEQVLVLGRFNSDILSWPSIENLRAQAIFWAQNSIATLWQRLIATNGPGLDPVREAWIAVKFGLDALRFRYLIRGARDTGALAVIRLAQSDPHLASFWMVDFIEAFQVAREYQPPPIATDDVCSRFLLAALSCIRNCLEEY